MLYHREHYETLEEVKFEELKPALRICREGVVVIDRPSFRVLTLVFAFLSAVQGALTQSTLPPAIGSDKPPETAESSENNAAEEKIAVVPVIGVGDLLKVGVLGAPESEQEVRVDAAGNVFLNFIGSVHVAGLTLEQAEDVVRKKLMDGAFFTDPQVSVFDKEYATQGVSVLGEVQKPNVYALLGPRRLFDVLSLAGGMTPKAGQEISITHRNHPQDVHTVLLSNDSVKAAEANVEVFPGDTVVVSKAGIVYIVGDVHKPSGVVMDSGTQMTVLKAIAMAEGTNSTAALNSAKLIRKTPTGPQEIPLELKKILASKSPDVRLQAEDIIFIPSSAAKRATTRGLEAILQAATGVAIYRPY